MSIAFFLAIVFMIIGLFGIIIPLIPSLPLIWLTALLYALYTGFSKISITFIVFFGILTAFSFIIDYLTTYWGTKKMGASKWGLLGAFVGMIVGFIFGNIIGIIIGPFIGVVVFELIFGKNLDQATKAGFGTFLGWLSSTIIKLVFGLIMIVSFCYIVLA
ncbi:MAG: DUF456 domain-containing protein [Pseudomonadota bacterium]